MQFEFGDGVVAVIFMGNWDLAIANLLTKRQSQIAAPGERLMKLPYYNEQQNVTLPSACLRWRRLPRRPKRKTPVSLKSCARIRCQESRQDPRNRENNIAFTSTWASASAASAV